MGDICSCANRGEENVKKITRTLIDKKVEIRDTCGLEFEGETLCAIAKRLPKFRPITMKLFNYNDRLHSTLKVSMSNKEEDNKYDDIMLEITFSSRNSFKIEIRDTIALIDGTESLDDFYIFGESEVIII